MFTQEWDQDVAIAVRERDVEVRGMKKMALEMAKSMKNEGVDIDFISKHTGLTIDDILRLK